jgi:hypothetical protein
MQAFFFFLGGGVGGGGTVILYGMKQGVKIAAERHDGWLDGT